MGKFPHRADALHQYSGHLPAARMQPSRRLGITVKERLHGDFQGGKLRILDIIEMLEQDLGVPVLHPGVAQAWEIMKRLRVREPKSGYGRLLAELP